MTSEVVRAGWARIGHSGRGFLAVLGGTGAAQLLLIFASPILARLYNPRDYALFGVVLGLVAVISSVASLRLELAIPLPADLADSRRLTWTCIMFAAVASFLLLATFPLTRGALNHLWPEAGGSAWFVFLPPLVFLTAIFTALTQLAIRLRSYTAVGRRALAQGVATIVAQTVLGLARVPTGLVAGALIGRLAGIRSLAKRTELTTEDIPDRATIAALTRRYWRFPVIFAPTAFVNVLGLQIVSLVLPSLYGSEIAGYYGLVVRVVALPVSLIGVAAGQVYLGELARVRDDGRRAAVNLFRRWSLVLAAAGLSLTVLSWLLAPWIFHTVFGDRWTTAGSYAVTLGVGYGMVMLGSPLQNTWVVYQRGWLNAAWDVGRLAATAFVLWFGFTHGSSGNELMVALSGLLFVSYSLVWFGCLLTVLRLPAESPVPLPEDLK